MLEQTFNLTIFNICEIGKSKHIYLKENTLITWDNLHVTSNYFLIKIRWSNIGLGNSNNYPLRPREKLILKNIFKILKYSNSNITKYFKILKTNKTVKKYIRQRFRRRWKDDSLVKHFGSSDSLNESTHSQEMSARVIKVKGLLRES